MTTELTIRIKMDNDAFKPDPRHEVSRILNYLSATVLQDGVPNHWDPTNIWDINGNPVGSVSSDVEDDTDDDDP